MVDDEELLRACKRLSFPRGKIFPLARELTPDQRAVAVKLSKYGSSIYSPFAFPSEQIALKRWLGLVKPGAVETPVMLKGKRRPLWQALQILGTKATGFVDKLPRTLQLAAFAESQMLSNGDDLYDLKHSPLHARQAVWKLGLFRTIGPESRAWALATLAKMTRPLANKSPALRLLVFLVLARSGVAIRPAWHRLFPIEGPAKLVDECMAALPATERATVLTTALRQELDSIDLSIALLARWPSGPLTKFVVDRCEWHEHPLRLEMDKLAPIAAKHPIVRFTLAAAKKKEPIPIELHIQKRRAPKTPHERALAAELAALGGSKMLLHDIVDEADRCVYDYYSDVGGDGSIYVAGTNEHVASIIQGGIDCSDPVLTASFAIAMG